MKKPNILFILSDQHSPHVIGCGGNEVIDTPSLDKLASEGITLTTCIVRIHCASQAVPP